jgi:hypothetical protein
LKIKTFFKYYRGSDKLFLMALGDSDAVEFFKARCVAADSQL